MTEHHATVMLFTEIYGQRDYSKRSSVPKAARAKKKAGLSHFSYCLFTVFETRVFACALKEN